MPENSPENVPEMEQRLVNLELKYMVLQRTVEELSDVVAAQQRSLDTALALLHRVQTRLVDIGRDVPNEPPPHY